MNEKDKKQLLAYRRKLIEFYRSQHNVQHAAFFSSRLSCGVLRKNLEIAEPLLRGMPQQSTASLPANSGGLIHVFYGTHEAVNGLKAHIQGLGQLLSKSKFPPEIAFSKQMDRGIFDLLSLAAVVYQAGYHEDSSIEDVVVDYQAKFEDYFFNIWEECPQPNGVDPLRWFFSPDESPAVEFEEYEFPDVVGLYCESNIVKLAVEAIDFYLCVLPMLKVAAKKPRKMPQTNRLSAKEEFAYRLLNYYLLNPNEVPKQTDTRFATFLGKSQSTISKRLKAIFGSDAAFEKAYSDGTIVAKIIPEHQLMKIRGTSQIPDIEAERRRLMEFAVQLFEQHNIPWEKTIEYGFGMDSAEN